MASTAKSFLMSLLVLLAISPQALSNESKSENVKVRKLESDLIQGNGKVQVPPHFSGIPPKNSPHLNIPSYTPYTSNDKNTPDRYHTVVPDFRFGTPNQGRISSAPIPKPPQLNVPSNTPYTGIPPKKTPHSNIPPYRPYAGIAPRKPPHSYPGDAPKESPQNKSSTPNDGIAPRKPPHFKIPTYTPYTGIPPKNSPKNNIPSYPAYAGTAPRKSPYLSNPSYTPYTGIPPKKSPHNNIPSYTKYAGIIAHRKSPRFTIPSYTPYIRGEGDALEPDPGRVTSVPAAGHP